MEFKNRYDGVEPYAVRLIRYKARELAGRFGWSRSDQDDIEQELLLDLQKRLPKFDPDRAQMNTFISRLVDHKVASMIEAQKAAVRDYRKTRASLNSTLLDGEGSAVEFGATIPEQETQRRKGTPALGPAERRDLRIDLRRTLASLPPHLSDLAQRLVRSSPTEISRTTGTPRTTLLKRIQKIREHFERAGLAQYLPRERGQKSDDSGT